MIIQDSLNLMVALKNNKKFVFQEIEAAAMAYLKARRSKRKATSSHISDDVIEAVTSCFMKECRKENISLAQLHKELFPREKYEMLRTQLQYLRDWKKSGFQ